MGRAADWLREERRRTLGDWVVFCAVCGHAQRYFEGGEAELPTACPECGGRIVSACPECGSRIASAFAVDCESCGAPLRESHAFGGPIRRVRPRR